MRTIKLILRAIGNAFAYLIVGMMTIVFISGGISILFSPTVTPDNIEVTSVAGTLAEHPAANTYGRSQYIRLRLKEYPDCVFSIEGDALEATKWGTIDECVGVGDSVFLNVDSEDFDAGQSSDESTDGPSFHAVYSFRTKACTLLKLDDYCREANSNQWLGWGFLLFGAALVWGIVAGIVRWLRKRSTGTNANAVDK